jgi:hypothetical protein
VSLVLGCMLTHLFVAGNVVSDDDELVRLCEGEFSELAGAFKLGSGASMRVKHLRSYTEGTLKELVQGREQLPEEVRLGAAPFMARRQQSACAAARLSKPFHGEEAQGRTVNPSIGVWRESRFGVSSVCSICSHIFGKIRESLCRQLQNVSR